MTTRRLAFLVMTLLTGGGAFAQAIPGGGKPSAPSMQDAMEAAPAGSVTDLEKIADFYLDLDTGGHRATINDIAVTPDGETIVTASDDKSIRVWDWRSGLTVRMIRGQIGPGNEGKTYALAVTPDGSMVAAAGYYGAGLGEQPPYGDIRLFDLGSGRIRKVLAGHEFEVHDLAFSPAGDMLAAAGGDGAVRLWRVPRHEGEDWTPLPPLTADSGRIERIAFALGGQRLAAATADNGLLLFDLSTGTAIDMPQAEPLRGTPLRALAVTPDGKTVATAAANGRLDIWNATDGSLAKELAQLDFQAGALSFSGNGARLAVSCRYGCADRNRSIVMETSTGATVAEYRGHDGSVSAGVIMPDGMTVVTAGGRVHEIRLWDIATGEERAVLAGLGRPVSAVAIDPAGTRIAWGSENPCPARVACPETMGPLSNGLDLPTADRSFEEPDEAGEEAARLRRAVLNGDGWSLAAASGGDYGFENATLQIRHGDAQATEIVNDDGNGSVHSAFTLLAGGDELVTGGSDGTIMAYHRAGGSFAGEFLGGHTGDVLAMAEAPPAKLLLTGSADQTMRLWNTATRELVASMFFADGDWIMWTPQGYFHSSPNGDRLIGWHVNQGGGEEARFVRARQLKQHLHSPEIVRRAIILGSASEAARELRGTDRQLEELLQRRPPEFSVKLAEGVEAVEGFVALEITGAGEAGADVSNFTVLSNDRRVNEFATRSVGGSGDRIVIEVPVEDGQNEILVTGYNEYGYLTERGVTALARKRVNDDPVGKLYLAVIGVEDYPLLPADCNGRSCDLAFPVADAAEFLRVVAERTAPLYNGLETLVLLNQDGLDENPDRAAAVRRIVGDGEIMEPESRAVSDEIEDFLDQPGPDDTTILFVAGHGVNVDEDYYFIPTDGRKADGDRWRRSSLVDWGDIQDAMDRAKGRRIMVLDTCHAANAYNPKLQKDAADARIVVFSATAANNTAAELPELGHGVFTYSILEGLRGKANSSGDGVRLLGLADYVYREVVRLSRKQQEPFYHIAQTSNFLLAQP